MSPDEESMYFLEHFFQWGCRRVTGYEYFYHFTSPPASLQSTWANSHQQCVRVPVAPYPCYHLVTLLSFAQLVCVYSNISYTFCSVLIIVELSTFPCIYWLFGFPSLVKYVLNLFVHFLFGGFVFSYWVLFYIQDRTPPSVKCVQILSHLWLVFPFSWWSFWMVIKSIVSIFSTVVTHDNLFPCLHG